MKIKTLVYSLLIIGLVGLIGYRITKNSDSKGPKDKGKEEQPITVNGSVIRLQTFDNNLSLSGSIEANEQVEIRSEVSGIVKNIYFQGGRMKFYAGIDLHSNNLVLVILDSNDKVIYSKRLPNDVQSILGVLAMYKEQIDAVAVESTYNWYWLVDALQAEGYEVRLVNTAAVVVYDGLKYSGDKADARHLAHLLRLGLLPCGYIYPKGNIRNIHRHASNLANQRRYLRQRGDGAGWGVKLVTFCIGRVKADSVFKGKSIGAINALGSNGP